MKHALIVLAALTTLSLPPACHAEDPAAVDLVELRLRFTEDQELTLTTTVEQHTTLTRSNRKSESNQTTAITMALKVLSVDDGAATVKVTIKAIALKRDTGGSWSYEYDSENPPDEVRRDIAAYAAVVGKTFTMKLMPTGQVAELEGHRAIVKAIRRAVPDRFIVEGMRDVIIDEPVRRFGEDGLTQAIEGAFGFACNTPVAVGGTWTRTIAIDYGIPVIADETYTLTGRCDGTVTIAREAALGPQEYGERKDGASLKSKYEVSGRQKGTLSVDEATGCVLKTTIIQELHGKRITSVRRARKEDVVPIESKATITIEIKEPPPEEETKDVPEAD